MKTNEPLRRTPPQPESTEETFRLLFHYHPIPMWVYDLKTLAFLEVNEAAVEKYSYTRKEFLAMTLKEIRPPEDVARLINDVGKKRPELQHSGEWRHQLKDGRIIDVEINSHTLELNGRKAALVISQDITERKRVEEALRRNEENFRSIVTSMDEGVVIQKKSGEITAVNPAAERILGLTAAELVGQYSESLTPDVNILHEDGSVFPRELHPAIITLQTGEPQSNVVMGIHKPDGSLVWISLNSQPLTSIGESKPYAVLTTFRDITKRKRTEEALRQSEERFRSLYEDSTIGLYRTTPDGRIIMANPALLKMLGYSSFAEISARNLEKEGFEPRHQRKQFLEQIEKDGEVKGLESAWNRQDGKVIFVRESARAIRDEKGNTRYYDGTVEDITERKQTEKTLHESEERLRIMFEYAPDAYFLTNLNGTFIDGNKAAEEVSGFSRSELIGKNFFKLNLLSAPQIVRAASMLVQNALGKPTGPDEFTLRRKNGSSVELEIRAIPTTINHQKLVLGIARDITERKRAEQELLRLRLGIERSSDAIFVTDTLGIIQYVNPAFEQIYGYNSHEAVGQTPRILKSGKNAPSYYEQLWNRLLSKKTFSAEIINKTKDGRLIIVEVSNNPILNERDNIIGFMGIHRDITVGKRLGEKEKSLEAQLQQAQKLEGIGTLASGIAHDFNNILGIILGYSTLLERLREDPQKHSESVEAITKATKRGASLVKQLLLFARKTEALLETVSVNGVITEITKLLKETFPKNIEISTSLQKDLPAIVADASQIHQVLLNLCVNARDAMPKSGTLSISTKTIESEAVASRFAKAERDPVARQYVQIEVADTGIGMDDSTLQKIFEPFFTTKGPGKGTGLGLSVVFGIVEHHSGFIDVRSAPGEGTTFTVYLPIPERAVEEVQAARKGPGEIPGGRETILVIEDEEMLRELVKTSLVSKGYIVLTAEDGMQGVEMYQSHQKEIALVLSDVGLPLLSGQEVFRKIREINSKAKVILASGFFDPETRSEMFKAGLKGFIQKPYLQDDVLQRIREVIDTNG